VTQGFGDIRDLNLFITAGVILILVAATNFVNLTTAQGSSRRLEVGVRRTMGATRSQRSIQFLIEFLMVILCASVATLWISSQAGPAMSSLLGINLPTQTMGASLQDLMILTMILSLLCCGYPALRLSTYRSALSNRVGGSSRGRRSLVAVQFVVSAFLLMSAVGMSHQMTYVQGKDLGFDQELLLNLRLFKAAPSLESRYLDIRSAFERHPNVLSVSASSQTIGGHNSVENAEVSRTDGQNVTVELDQIFVDDRFVQTFGLDMIDGQDFGRPTSEGLRCILNEKAARLLGFYNDADATSPVGRTLRRKGGEMEVIGVVRDFAPWLTLSTGRSRGADQRS
jgi:putative ABC transport system permease protein